MADLDAVLTTLTSTVSAVSTSVQTLITNFKALEAQIAAGVDTTQEVAAVNAAITALQGEVSAMAAVEPAPAPAPEAPSEPAA